MEIQELPLLCASSGGMQRGAGYQPTPEMTHIGGMMLSRLLVHHQPSLGSPGPCPRDMAVILSHALPMGPASVLCLLGGYSFKTQVYLWKMLFFKHRELTATACARQPVGSSGVMGEQGEQGLCREVMPLFGPCWQGGHSPGILEQADSPACWSRVCSSVSVGVKR